MTEPLPGTSGAVEVITEKDEDGFEKSTALVGKDATSNSYTNQQHSDLTTIVPVRRSSFAFLDPCFGLLLKESPLGIKSCVTERSCLSIIESDFAALVLSGDKQIVRNGRVINSFKVSAGNKQHQYFLKTSDAQKREMNYLSHISRKYSSVKKGKHLVHARATSQKAILKQSLLNFVVSNQWFAPQKPVLTLLEESDNVEGGDNKMVKWMDLKSSTEESEYSSDVITTSGFRSLVRSSLSKEKSSEKVNVPVMLKTWRRDASRNIFWKAAAVRAFGQKKLTLQQTCSATDDITMNDLAGYFDNLVHIPKEMSSMAKMMYQ